MQNNDLKLKISLLVLGVLVIGGIVYYVGKSDYKTVNDNSIYYPEPDQKIIVTNTEDNSDCSPNSPSTIQVLSPNGGEVYAAGQQIIIKWKSCNVDPDSVGLILGEHNSSSPYEQREDSLTYAGFSLGGFDTYKGTVDDGGQQVTLPTSDDAHLTSGQHYFIIVSGTGDATNIGSGYSPRDYSDNLFTINVSPVSTTLPQYVREQANWPPVIQNSTTAYSCTTGNSEMSHTNQKVISGKTYCITTFIEGAAGSSYGEYTYTRASGSGTKTTNFTLNWSNCGGYDEYEQCQTSVNTFLGNLDVLIASLM